MMCHCYILGGINVLRVLTLSMYTTIYVITNVFNLNLINDFFSFSSFQTCGTTEPTLEDFPPDRYFFNRLVDDLSDSKNFTSAKDNN